ncbi:hypothetical protein P879_09474 [Paragonimus westermani]|uniref:Uncharacterized protein n=1 Tax=Paragonimus westermani TaxID=34504 RepID=A0A8T0DFZ8_9TREM|nr:hypothetical protein P879_09474 [Paragonimus westermani]
MGPAPENPGGWKPRESYKEEDSPKDTFDRYHDWDDVHPITPPVKSTEHDVGPGILVYTILILSKLVEYVCLHQNPLKSKLPRHLCIFEIR